MEGGLRGLRHRYDVTVHRSVAAEHFASDQESRRRILQRSAEQRQADGHFTLGSGESVPIDKQNVEKLKDEIEKAILKQADLTKLSKQIDITMTGEGLKIDLIEDKGGTFFESGSPKLSDNGVALLNLLSAQLKVLPNRLLIEGHTDAQPFSGDSGYTNWELSRIGQTPRAGCCNRMEIGPNQISQVRGYADQMLRVPSNPLDPSNRRVSLIVQWAEPPHPRALERDAIRLPSRPSPPQTARNATSTAARARVTPKPAAAPPPPASMPAQREAASRHPHRRAASLDGPA